MKNIYLITTFLSFLSLAHGAIVGGKNVADDKAAGVLNIFTDENLISSCTASKIKGKFLITAAHCVHGKNLKVLPWSHSSYIDLGNEKTVIYGLHIKKIHINPSYIAFKKLNQKFNSSDIAIIEIEQIEGAYLQKFLELPDLELDFSPVLAGEEISIYGYGEEARNEAPNQVYKKKSLELKVMDDDSFNKLSGDYFPGMSVHSSKIFENKIITLATPTSGMSEGDSGGPVMRVGKIVGINSSYLNNKEAYAKLVYINLHSRLSKSEKWILGIVKEKQGSDASPAKK